jgi:hypothetical protein
MVKTRGCSSYASRDLGGRKTTGIFEGAGGKQHAARVQKEGHEGFGSTSLLL